MEHYLLGVPGSVKFRILTWTILNEKLSDSSVLSGLGLCDNSEDFTPTFVKSYSTTFAPAPVFDDEDLRTLESPARFQRGAQGP